MGKAWFKEYPEISKEFENLTIIDSPFVKGWWTNLKNERIKEADYDQGVQFHIEMNKKITKVGDKVFFSLYNKANNSIELDTNLNLYDSSVEQNKGEEFHLRIGKDHTVVIDLISLSKLEKYKENQDDFYELNFWVSYQYESIALPRGEEYLKLDNIFQSESIFIVGTEQHSATYGNKLMFPAQAVREVSEMKIKKNNHVTILIFEDGYNQEQLKAIKNDSNNLYDKLNFVKINSREGLVKYINEGKAGNVSFVDRTIIKIKTIKIFAHGLASTLDFGLDGFNRNSQWFKIIHVTKLEKTAFDKEAEVYSYACRTGNADVRSLASAKNYTYGNDWLNFVKPQESLAQKLAEHLNVTVYAYLIRSDYTSTWNDGGDEKFEKTSSEIEDERINGFEHVNRWFFDWDETLWNSKGAYAPPTVGATPKGIPRIMYKFVKGKEPIKRNK